MSTGLFTIDEPENEAELDYAPGSLERMEVRKKLEEFSNEVAEIPIIIGGKEYHTGQTIDIVTPHKHSQVIGGAHMADEELLHKAINSAMESKKRFMESSWEKRTTILMKAADLLSGPWRSTIIAATMLGISKTVHQAEIDVAELIDMYRFNSYYLTQILGQQPVQTSGMLNRIDYRPLDGFVLAINPFNFTSIAGNLPTAPTLFGNTVLWKPATSALFNAYHIMKLLEASGLPPGVINFVPSRGSTISKIVVSHPDLGGIHFTGSTQTMEYIWKKVAQNIENYNQYPRIVGETGGKNFVIVHSSADIEALVAALIRGNLEYQGQKCSAAARAYIPESLWPEVRDKLVEEYRTVTVGDPADFNDFMSSIVDKNQFNRVVEYIEEGKQGEEYELVYGGEYDDSVGYYIYPTIFRTMDPRSRLMREEIFGPVLMVYVYQDEEYLETLKLCDSTSKYGLTGSVFAEDSAALELAEKALRFAAGNFYLNDKPTGSVIGRQPFGGSRKSGTNDKTGYILNLLRWTSARSIKEMFNPPRNYRRPFMGNES